MDLAAQQPHPVPVPVHRHAAVSAPRLHVHRTEHVPLYGVQTFQYLHQQGSSGILIYTPLIMCLAILRMRVLRDMAQTTFQILLLKRKSLFSS